MPKRRKKMPDNGNGNGFTNKEMLQMLLENQAKIDSRLEIMQKEMTGKISKMELMGWVLMISAISMIAMNWNFLF
jgi:hypothetical protein